MVHSRHRCSNANARTREMNGTTTSRDESLGDLSDDWSGILSKWRLRSAGSGLKVVFESHFVLCGVTRREPSRSNEAFKFICSRPRQHLPFGGGLLPVESPRVLEDETAGAPTQAAHYSLESDERGPVSLAWAIR